MWIAIDGVVEVGANAHTLQAMVELLGSMLAAIVGDDDRTYHEVAALELVAQAQHILVVGDAEVGTHLVLFDVASTHHDDDFDAIAKLGEHA